MGYGINLFYKRKKPRELERPVASIRGGRDVTDRYRNEVIVVGYYCFFLIIIVGPPNLPDPVWPLKYTHFF